MKWRSEWKSMEGWKWLPSVVSQKPFVLQPSLPGVYPSSCALQWLLSGQMALKSECISRSPRALGVESYPPVTDSGSLGSGLKSWIFRRLQNVSDHLSWESMSETVGADLPRAPVVPVVKAPFLLPKFRIRGRVVEPSWQVVGIKEQ